MEGPESCNSNNMLKLSEDLFDDTHDAKYADFYEATMWNHIMSTQDPKTGGYVYFTSLRPLSYRIYSQVNQGMWCCVGTGMENHSKYGHFIYTHSATNDTLYVNLFTASELNSKKFGIRQETSFPYEQKTKLTITKGGKFTLAIRKPSWASADGKASYTYQTKKWKAGEVVNVELPMKLRYEECPPDYKSYIAFKYGPILLGARTETEAQLPNEYGGEGRMDHSPGARSTAKPLSSAPLLIGNRSEVLSNIQTKDLSKLSFTLSTDKGTLPLVPFYSIQHSRYSCYFFQGTKEDYANSDMGRKDAEEQALQARTLDYVATGEQQSEAGHEVKFSTGSTSGSYRGENYRDAKNGEFIQYVIDNKGLETELSLMLRFITSDRGRTANIFLDDEKIGDITIQPRMQGADEQGFFNVEYAIPEDLLIDPQTGNIKSQLTFRIVASPNTMCPGLYYLRLMKK